MKKLIFIFCALTLCSIRSNLFADCYWLQDLGSASIYNVVINPLNPTIIYAASSNQIYLSIDGGTSWIPQSVSFSPASLQISHSSPDILYAGTSSGKVYKSTNAGLNWTDMSIGITESAPVQAICIKPNDPNTVVIALFNGSSDAVNGIYKTTNGGTSWIVSNSGIGSMKNFLSLSSNPLQPNTIFAGSSYSLNPVTGPCYIYKSYNFGSNWFNSSNGLGISSTSTDVISELSFSSIDSNTLLAGLNFNTTNGGPYLTTNGGATWSQKNGGLSSLFISAAKTGSVLIKPGYNNILYLGISYSLNNQGGGVWRSDNSGLSWYNVNWGVMDSTKLIYSMASYYSSPSIFFGVPTPTGQTAGIYEYYCIGGIKKIQGSVPDKFSLSQNYPNPFNPSTKIKFSLPVPSKGGVTLTIYDVLGRKVTDLIPPLRGGQEGLQPGTYEVEWNGTNFASGIYFYKLETLVPSGESFTQTRKMVLLK